MTLHQAITAACLPSATVTEFRHYRRLAYQLTRLAVRQAIASENLALLRASIAAYAPEPSANQGHLERPAFYGTTGNWQD